MGAHIREFWVATCDDCGGKLLNDDENTAVARSVVEIRSYAVSCDWVCIGQLLFCGVYGKDCKDKPKNQVAVPALLPGQLAIDEAVDRG